MVCSICGVSGHNKRLHAYDSGLKQCKGCLEEKPLEEFYIVDPNYSYREPYCRECKTSLAPPRKLVYCSVCKVLGHSARTHAAYVSGVRRCPRCLVEKPFSMYHKSRRGQFGLHVYCKDCSYDYKIEQLERSLDYSLTKLLSSARQSSKRRGLENDLDRDYVLDLYKTQDGKCYYTGHSLSLKYDKDRISIDRIDPAVGYLRGNVALTSWRINQLKMDLGESQFLQMCRDVVAHHDAKSIQR